MIQRPLRELFDAMHHGKFEFEDFLALDVMANTERVGWKDRTIYKPTKKLKAFHSFLCAFLFDHLGVNERVAFAYRRGTNPHSALHPHANSRAFYQADLAKFFDSISAQQVEAVIRDAVSPVSDLDSYVGRIIDMVTVENRLPIGFSTSPAISNACMRPFDDAFEAECQSRQLVYTRYADDIIVSGKERSQIVDVGELVDRIIKATLGPAFSLNKTKTKRSFVGRKVAALGMVILPTGQISIDGELKKKVEYLLHFFVKDRARFAKASGSDVEHGMQQLSGLISHIHTADPAYLEKLRRKFGVTVVDSFLRRSAK